MEGAMDGQTDGWRGDFKKAKLETRASESRPGDRQERKKNIRGVECKPSKMF